MFEWKERKFPTLRKATRIQYQAVSERHFQLLSVFPINSITSKDIDAWLADRKANLGNYPQAKRRLSFDRELMILKLILVYYGEYYEEDTNFRNPIKDRHWRDSKLNISRTPKKKDVKEEEFRLFRVEIEKLKQGAILKHLATTQYYQALRISEVAAMKWKHVIFNWENPQQSRIQIDQHVVYAVEKGELPIVDPGFKNSDSLGGIKEMPMFPQTFETLAELYGDGVGKSLEDYIFQNEYGDVFRYHTVRNRYNRAFKLAGFKYTATHVMRHGWTCEIFNATGGDYGIAGQLLGDISDKAIKTYAKRANSALTNLAQGMWAKAT
ncbi:MAG TPA: tyrosine-type recombinase/integrase [Oligoflexus sp.]|uniref:tyrosine-type recombinase/integrase n=1 Tax=Oligoflexus sp. TaxID=1971216 RepID=UPI002D38AC77|nr:tyrosine-type recombinase/integrase [Oligoflexus sp.]HYX32287.1 tyrosine-type recombinase/integrase [Oligoflexus sp.]